MQRDLYHELKAAWRIRDKAAAKRAEAAQIEADEQENIRKAEAEGTMAECGCCYSDFPLNRMIHCDGDELVSEIFGSWLSDFEIKRRPQSREFWKLDCMASIIHTVWIHEAS